ncbi:TRAP transporter small permease [Salinicoccus roseus]|uniref:TRAP transporter small permease n=1 Tax=Salinicoccus roseus TaxID=45670 RepID=UPI002301CF4E|nr:TRAP transporter small permease [Salinicoccus roseus]
MMKVLKWLDEHFEEYILIALSIFTVFVIFSQVVMRYVFNSSLSWSEEIARYGFIWLIYIGVSYGVKRRKHLRVDALTMLFEEKGTAVIKMIANILFLIFALVVSYYGVDIVTKITRESAALQIPMEYVYASLAFGMILTSIRLIQNIILDYRTIQDADRKNEDNEVGGRTP